MRRKLLAVPCILFLAGCASLPTSEEMANADYGQYPSSHEEVVKDYLNMNLKDPTSVMYRNFTAPQKYYLGNRIDGVQYGYLVCATLNAKNSYGAYTGYKTDAILIRNNAVVQYVDNGEWWGKQLCN